MRERRVGTLSMGLVLIGLGAFLIYSHANPQAALFTAVRWWPLLLFLLGGEILFYSYVLPGNGVKLKYDIFSIMIIFLIVITTLGVFGITQVGIMPRLTMMVNAQQFHLETPLSEIALDPDVKKIVVEQSPDNLTVRTGTDRKVASYGRAYVNADNRETADRLLAEKTLSTKKVGDTLFIGFNTYNSGNGMSYYARLLEQTLLVPSDCAVEIKGGDYLSVIANDLKGNLIIDHVNRTDIRLPNTADVEITAVTSAADNLKGTVPWNVNPVKGNSENPKNQGNDENKVTGTAVLGKGTGKIDIITEGEVTVNQVK